MDLEDDWHDEKNWYKANPSLGYTIKIGRVREAYKQALSNSAEENIKPTKVKSTEKIDGVVAAIIVFV